MSTQDAGTAPDHQPAFGAEQRRRRQLAGLSLADLAKVIHYTKPYISRIENGQRTPSDHYCRAVDTALHADGELMRLAPPPVRRRAKPVTPIKPVADGPIGPQLALGFTAAIVSPSVAKFGGRLQAVAADPTFANTAVLIFEQLRRMARQTGPTQVLGHVLSQYVQFHHLAAAGGPEQRRHQAMAARCADLAGWLYQEQDDLRRAISATQVAMDLAQRSGYADLHAYLHTRLAEIMIARRDFRSALLHVQQAHEGRTTSAQVHAFASHREAQAYAAMGDARRCLDALSHAKDHLGRVKATSAPALGSTTMADLNAVVTGWCFHDLGRHDRAIQHLEAALTGIPAESRRMRGLMSGKLSVAYASIGERAHTRRWCEEALHLLPFTDSASAVAQLRRLGPFLQRWQHDSDAVELRFQLTNALRAA